MVARLLLVQARDWRPWVLAAFWPILAVVPWIVLRYAYNIPGSDLFAGRRLNWTNLVPGLRSFGQAFDTGPYNLTFWLLLASLPFVRQSLWILPGLVIWQLAGLLGAI